MIRTNPSGHQAIYDAIYTALRQVLREAIQAKPGDAEGLDSLPCRVSGALYALLMAHPIDRHGRCRLCRRPGSVLGRRRQDCAVYFEVRSWLGESDTLLRTRIADQWQLTRKPEARVATTPRQRTTPDPAAPDTPDVPPRTTPEAERRPCLSRLADTTSEIPGLRGAAREVPDRPPVER
ncbi:MAG: hypothetical protein WCF33_22595 [Pseudonocardiaceae bacterium]